MPSTLIGALRVVLSADTAEFKTGLDQATKLTGDFSGKLTGLSAQVSSFSKVFGTMFTVGAITAAADKVLDYAGKIQDLADQTGLTAEALQEMGFAAKQSGASLEGFTNAAFKLGTILAEGTTKARDSVRALGLSYEQLAASSPAEQFRMIASALSKVEDVQERNRLGVILMGKGYKEVAGAINAGYDELAARAGKSSDAQIKALSDAGDAWDELKSKVLNLGVLLGGSFAQSMQALGVALKQDAQFLEDWTGFVRLNTQAMEDWGSIFLKASEGPKVVHAAMKNLPEPLRAVNISTEEQEKRMKALEAAHGKVKISTKAVGQAQEEVDDNIQRLTSSLEAQIAAFQRTNTIASTVDESFRLMRVDFTETIPILQNLTTNGFEPFKAALTASGTAIRTWADTAREIFGGVPQAIVAAIQGGGSIIGAAGASIGVSLMTKFQEKFGPAIKAALPFGIGEAVTALLPTLGALFGPIAEKIGGFFRKIFGGPSKEELAGREQVAAFEDQLQANLDASQLAEAGNEDWKKTVIAIRDAYIAAGHTEGEALAAAERLWQSSKKGAGETEAAIAAIQKVLDQAAAAADGLAESMDNALRDRTINIGVQGPNHKEGDTPADSGDGHAVGTLGRYGSWFKDFGSGLKTSLHGMEAVVRQDQAVPFAMDVMSGLNSGAQATATPAARPAQVSVALENQIILDGQVLKDWLKRTIVSAIDNNEHGFRTDTRDVLGVTG